MDLHVTQFDWWGSARVVFVFWVDLSQRWSCIQMSSGEGFFVCDINSKPCCHNFFLQSQPLNCSHTQTPSALCLLYVPFTFSLLPWKSLIWPSTTKRHEGPAETSKACSYIYNDRKSMNSSWVSCSCVQSSQFMQNMKSFQKQFVVPAFFQFGFVQLKIDVCTFVQI